MSGLDTFTGGIDERFVCRLACEQALPGCGGGGGKRRRSDWPDFDSSIPEGP